MSLLPSWTSVQPVDMPTQKRQLIVRYSPGVAYHHRTIASLRRGSRGFLQFVVFCRRLRSTSCRTNSNVVRDMRKCCRHWSAVKFLRTLDHTTAPWGLRNIHILRSETPSCMSRVNRVVAFSMRWRLRALSLAASYCFLLSANFASSVRVTTSTLRKDVNIAKLVVIWALSILYINNNVPSSWSAAMFIKQTNTSALLLLVLPVSWLSSAFDSYIIRHMMTSRVIPGPLRVVCEHSRTHTLAHTHSRTHTHAHTRTRTHSLAHSLARAHAHTHQFQHC